MAMKSIFAAAAAVAGVALACAGDGISTMSVTGPTGRTDADAEARPLFEDGGTAWRIVVPDGASRYMRYAAGELSNTVEKISGARLGVVEASNAPARNGSGKYASCGWPIDAHRDFTSAATLVFK